MTNPEYTQGICEDGAAILRDGQPMTVEEILDALRDSEQLKAEVERLSNREAAMCDLHYAQGAKRGFEWGQHDDNAALAACIESRVPEAVRTVKEIRQQAKEVQS